jgi:hypothetical protein
MVITGLISYSLYLYHPPVFAFLRIARGGACGASRTDSSDRGVLGPGLLYLAIRRVPFSKQAPGENTLARRRVCDIHFLAGRFWRSCKESSRLSGPDQRERQQDPTAFASVSSRRLGLDLQTHDRPSPKECALGTK